MTLVFLSFGTFESAAASPDEQARRQELHNAAQARYDAGDFDEPCDFHLGRLATAAAVITAATGDEEDTNQQSYKK